MSRSFHLQLLRSSRKHATHAAERNHFVYDKPHSCGRVAGVRKCFALNPRARFYCSRLKQACPPSRNHRASRTVTNSKTKERSSTKEGRELLKTEHNPKGTLRRAPHFPLGLHDPAESKRVSRPQPLLNRQQHSETSPGRYDIHRSP